MDPIRTDFKGYEGQSVAIDARTGDVLLADKDLLCLFAKAKGRKHVIVHGRVPYADEPVFGGGPI